MDFILYSKISKLYYTLKPLRFKQLFFRLVYKFKPVVIKRFQSGVTSGNWCWNGPSKNVQSLFKGFRETKSYECFHVRFLSLNGEVNCSNSWNCSSKEKLWLYNLHYFDDLNSVSYKQREDIHVNFINRWIDENPPCLGNGWEPYPLSLRLVNWVKWLSRKQNVEQRYLDSILQQAEALSRQLEYHILGNHLFANAKALTFVGCYLRGPDAEKYLNMGLSLLDKEIPEQFLEDGAHFELSPMYHCILLWDLLELINLAKISQEGCLIKRLTMWSDTAQKALSWLQAMIHGDGDVSFFNDSSIGIANLPADIFDYGRRLGLCWFMPQYPLAVQYSSGYSRVSFDKYTLLFDHAQVGPDYLPGHAHADTLSFELSLGNERVFVNSGTSLYGISEERLRQRQTAAHNTVEVCSHSSSEVWSGFRVARRAKATLEEATACQDYVRLTASHDGYKRLRPKVSHKRSITSNANGLRIEDTLTEKVSAVFHLHIHPDVTCTRINSSAVQLKSKKGKKLTFKADSDIELLPTTYHPNFGVTIVNEKIVIPFESGCLVTRIDVEG